MAAISKPKKKAAKTRAITQPKYNGAVHVNGNAKAAKRSESLAAIRRRLFGEPRQLLKIAEESTRLLAGQTRL